MKRKKVILILMLGLIGLSTLAQITFVKTYDNNNYSEGYAVQQTSDGGYIMTGYKQGNNISNIYLVKTDANGDTLWTRTYSYGSAAWSSNKGYSVQQTNDGGYIVVGTIEDTTTAPVHLYLIKTNSNGDTLWTKSYGSTGNDYGYSVKQTLDSGFIIAGATDSLGAGGYDAFLIKTNSTGDTLWTKTYGGIYDDYAQSVELTTDGGYIIVGSTKSSNNVNTNVYLIKTDSTGDTLWTKTYGNGNGNEEGYSVKQTLDGGYIIAGGFDFYLIKTNSIGDTLWTKTYFDNAPGGGTAYSVQQTIDGGYIIAGTVLNQIEWFAQIDLIKINSTGDTLWTKIFNGLINGTGNSVQQTTDGGYIITGQEYGTVLIKTDTNGNSGCSQYQSWITIPSYTTHVSNTSTIVKSGCLVSNPSKPVGSGGTVTTECFTTGINEIKATEDLSLSPNPFTTTTTLTLQGNYHNPSLFIYNLLGQVVGVENFQPQHGTNQQITIQRNQLPSGMYFYKLIDENKEVIGIGKMVVE